MIFRCASPLMPLFAVVCVTSSLAGIPPLRALSEISQTPPCGSEFPALWSDEVSKEVAVRLAVERKEPPQEVCRLFGEFLEAEEKVTKYVEINARKCGISDDHAKQIKVEQDIRAAALLRTCAAAHE